MSLLSVSAAAERLGVSTRQVQHLVARGDLALLSGADAEWMGERQRARLKTRLRGLSSVGLVARTRERAVVTRYRAHSRAGQYLLAELVYPENAAGELGLADANTIDGYLAAADVAGVVSRHGLARDDEGRVTLRATTMYLDLVRDLSDRGVVLAALDLAESLDVRERRAGLDALDQALEAFRG